MSYYEIDKHHISLKFENRKREELLFITDEYLTPYLTFIKDNQRLFKVSIKHFHSMNMDEVYGRMFEHIFSPILYRFGIPETDSDAFVSIFALQRSMLASFEGMNETEIVIMNVALGSAVCVIVFLLGFNLLRNKKILFKTLNA